MKHLFYSILIVGFSFTSNASVKLNSFSSNYLTSIVNVQMQPEVPHANDQITLFLNIDTDFSSTEEMNTILEAKLDGATIGLLNPTTGLWIAAFESAAVGNHVLSVSYYLEDKVQADSIRATLSQLEQDIATIDGSLAIQDDATEIAILQAERDAKVAQQTAASAELAGLKSLVTTESFNFTVL